MNLYYCTNGDEFAYITAGSREEAHNRSPVGFGHCRRVDPTLVLEDIGPVNLSNAVAYTPASYLDVPADLGVKQLDALLASGLVGDDFIHAHATWFGNVWRTEVGGAEHCSTSLSDLLPYIAEYIGNDAGIWLDPASFTFCH